MKGCGFSSPHIGLIRSMNVTHEVLLVFESYRGMALFVHSMNVMHEVQLVFESCRGMPRVSHPRDPQWRLHSRSFGGFCHGPRDVRGRRPFFGTGSRFDTRLQGCETLYREASIGGGGVAQTWPTCVTRAMTL